MVKKIGLWYKEKKIAIFVCGYLVKTLVHPPTKFPYQQNWTLSDQKQKSQQTSQKVQISTSPPEWTFVNKGGLDGIGRKIQT